VLSRACMIVYPTRQFLLRVACTLPLSLAWVACSSERPTFGSAKPGESDAAAKGDKDAAADGGKHTSTDGGAAGASSGTSDAGPKMGGAVDASADGGNLTLPSASDAGKGKDSDASADAAPAPECREDSECVWSDCLGGTCAKAIKIAGGQGGARCALRDRGDVACWGVARPALGSGMPGAFVSEPTLVRGIDGEGILTDVTDIAVGAGTFCALLASGRVVCWGNDYSGGLGRGNAADSGGAVSPGFVVGVSGSGTLGGIVKLGARAQNTHCALRAGGDAVCWGANPNGTLGNGNGDNTGIPGLVLGEGGVGTLQALSDIQGAFTSCALSQSGQVYCWGSNQFYVIAQTSVYPTPIPGVGGAGLLDNAVALSTGASPCALLAGGEVACWGDDSYGALGRGKVGPAGIDAWTAVPELVLDSAGTAPLRGITAIEGVSDHNCALTEQNTVYCWGSNANYQLGRGPAPGEASGLPAQVLGVDGTGVLEDVVSIGTGLGFSCAIRKQGDVVCWGLIEERFEPEYSVRTQFPALITKPTN
jgi:alpha-tubulin suppressor-like RCC1 family protein